MGTNFDAAELLQVFDNALAKSRSKRFMTAGILAVAAHVRSQTLMEAAAVCDGLELEYWANFKGRGDKTLQADPTEQGKSLGAYSCKARLLELTNCQGKLDGSVVKDSLATPTCKNCLHVRAQTLREAAGVCESSAMIADEQERSSVTEFNRAYWKGLARAFRQAANNMRNAASARETGGAAPC